MQRLKGNDYLDELNYDLCALLLYFGMCIELRCWHLYGERTSEQVSKRVSERGRDREKHEPWKHAILTGSLSKLIHCTYIFYSLWFVIRVHHINSFYGWNCVAEDEEESTNAHERMSKRIDDNGGNIFALYFVWFHKFTFVLTHPNLLSTNNTMYCITKHSLPHCVCVRESVGNNREHENEIRKKKKKRAKEKENKRKNKSTKKKKCKQCSVRFSFLSLLLGSSVSSLSNAFRKSYMGFVSIFYWYVDERHVLCENEIAAAG